ncbi:hypothetical protein [uncultured Ilyobacter sp.]|nr:hypothetical protein [uncultured Ilyobacter sp.]
MATEDAEKKNESHRVRTKTIYAFFCESFFIPFPLPLTKSVLRIVKN